MSIKNINGSYFEDTLQGLQAVSDPAKLQQLKAGTLTSEQGSLPTSTFAPATVQPSQPQDVASRAMANVAPGTTPQTGAVGVSDSVDAAKAKEEADKVKASQTTDQQIADLTKQKQLSDLKVSLGLEKPPVLPNLVGTYESLREKGGIPKIEEDLNAIRTEKQTIQADLAKFTHGELTGSGTVGFASGRISEQQRSAQERMDFLTRQENAAVDRLNNQNSYINTVMNLPKQDYDTSKQQFDDNYTKAYQMQQLTNAQANEVQKDANAYLTSVTNMLSTHSVDWATIDPAMKADITKNEIRAGWAPGTLQEFAKLKPKANL